MGTWTWWSAFNPNSPIEVEIPSAGTSKCNGLDLVSPRGNVVVVDDAVDEDVVDDVGVSTRRTGSLAVTTE